MITGLIYAGAIFCFLVDMIISFYAYCWMTPCLLFFFIVLAAGLFDQQEIKGVSAFTFFLLIIQQFFLYGISLYLFLWAALFMILLDQSFRFIGLQRTMLSLLILALSMGLQQLIFTQWTPACISLCKAVLSR